MFSVVIPAFNCEKTITSTLDSVKGQTRVDLIDEIIIINDGSVDSTEEVIITYINNNPELNIVYRKHNNHGVSYTRNYGIRIAKSAWIALLDSDDAWKPNKIERQVECIQQNSDIVFIGASYPIKFLFREYWEGVHKINAYQLCIRSMPTTPSVIFKREIGLELGLFNTQMEYCEDINFFQRFLLVDSYFILAEDLVEISIGKNYHGESGLSSNLYKMNAGRNRNIKELREMGLIGTPFMILMLLFDFLKLIRRLMIKKIEKMKNSILF